MRKNFFRQLRFVAIYFFALFAFTTIAYASVRSLNYNYYGPYPMGFYCYACANDSWLVAYDLNGYPYHAICNICYSEYLLDEEGNPIQIINPEPVN